MILIISFSEFSLSNVHPLSFMQVSKSGPVSREPLTSRPLSLDPAVLVSSFNQSTILSNHPPLSSFSNHLTLDTVEQLSYANWWPASWGNSRSSSTGLESCMRDRGFALLDSPIVWRNVRPVLQGFQRWSNICRFLISVMIDNCSLSCLLKKQC